MLQLGFLVALIVCLVWPGDVPDPAGVGEQLSWSALCLCAAVPILLVAVSDRQHLRTPLDLFLGVYLLLVLATSITSVDRPQTLLSVIALLGNLAVFYATVVTLRRTDLTAAVLLVVVVVGIAILELIAVEFHLEQGLLERPAIYPRPAGWSGYPELGLLAGIQIAILIAVAQDRQSWWPRVATLGLLAVSLGELAFLYSRLAWIALIGVVGAAGAVAIRARHIWRLALVGIVILALGAVLVSQNATFRTLAGNLVGMESSSAGARAASRFRLWQRTAALIRDYPLTGVGLGNFAAVYEPNYNPHLNPDLRRGGHAHNLWLHQTAELGLPGGVAYLALWVAVLVIGWKRAPSSLSQRAAFYVLVAVAFRSLGDNMFFSLADGSARLNTLTWIFFAVASARGEATKG